MCGGIYKISEHTVLKFRKEGYKKFTGIEKNDMKEIMGRIEGRWTKEIQVFR